MSQSICFAVHVWFIKIIAWVSFFFFWLLNLFFQIFMKLLVKIYRKRYDRHTKTLWTTDFLNSAVLYFCSSKNQVPHFMGRGEWRHFPSKYFLGSPSFNSLAPPKNHDKCVKIRPNFDNLSIKVAKMLIFAFWMHFALFSTFKRGTICYFCLILYWKLPLNKFINEVYKSVHFYKGNFTENTLVMLNLDQNSPFLRKFFKKKFFATFC